jgi:hypothetical protein
MNTITFVVGVVCMACACYAGGHDEPMPKSCANDMDAWKSCMDVEMKARGVDVNMTKGEQCLEKSVASLYPAITFRRRCQPNAMAVRMATMFECVKAEVGACVDRAVPFEVVDRNSAGGNGGNRRGGSGERDDKSMSEIVSEMIANTYAHCGIPAGDCLRQTVPAAVVNDADSVARKYCEANAKCKPR